MNIFLLNLFILNVVNFSKSAYWGSFKDDGCSGDCIRQKSSILRGISGSWKTECENQPAIINNIKFTRPTRCVNNLNMWGEFDVLDIECCAIDKENWIKYLPVWKTKFTQLNIPGTHDSCAYKTTPAAKTQTMSLTEQLKNGIRYFDIRCRHINNAFAIHHDRVYLKMNFDDVLKSFKDYLSDHNSEFILVSLQKEYKDEGNTRTFEETLEEYINKNRNLWYTGDDQPNINDVKGKMVLIRKNFNHMDDIKGIDTYAKYNTKYDKVEGPVTVYVQDYCCDSPMSSRYDSKWKSFKKLFDQAKNDNTDTLYLNSLNIGYDGIMPETHAMTMNRKLKPYLLDYAKKQLLDERKHARVGVIIMDYPKYNDHIKPILNLNLFGLRSAEHGVGIRLWNHYRALSVDTIMKCYDECDKEERCAAITLKPREMNALSETCWLYEKKSLVNTIDDKNFLSFFKQAYNFGEKDGNSKAIIYSKDNGDSKVYASECNKKIVAYFPSWGSSTFRLEQAKRLTHAIFAFFETMPDGTIKLGSPDSKNKKEDDLAIAQKRLENFKHVCSKAKIKTLFAVGGWENSQYFSSIAADPSKRAKFITSVIQIVRNEKFDGIDIDWEYPVTGGAVEGLPNDKQFYVQLMKELRVELKSDYLITFAGAAGDWTLTPGFDLPALLKYADWVNVMTYDYFGPWNSKWGAYTGPPAPLFYGNPKGFSGKVNADWTIRHYVCKTRLPHKIVMGVPFYGRFWKNVGEPIDPKDGMWRIVQSNEQGYYTGGFMAWCELKKKFLKDSNYKVEMHKFAKSPYAFNEKERTFLGFENPESLQFKVKYAESYNLGGMMIWAIDQDDDTNSMLSIVSSANLCMIKDPKAIMNPCLPIEEKRWWTLEDGEDKAGLCGKSAPLFKGYYPICDPDDPGYKCCGASGYCGSGVTYCDCPNCVDYGADHKKILEEPIKPTVNVSWYFLNAGDGQRGRCGRGVPLLNGQVPTCNPDDSSAHCCSNGGYCGTGGAYCKCDGCIDFKKNPTYVYKKKTWWEWSDGPQLAGKCGKDAPKINEKVAECDPESNYYCCSKFGSCGSGKEFCECDGCIDYRKK